MIQIARLPLGSQDPRRREVSLLIIGVWSISVLIWAAPIPFLGSSLKSFVPWVTLSTNIVGIGLSYVLYASFVISRRSRGALRAIAISLMVIALSTLHAWLDAELIRAFQSRFAPLDMSNQSMAAQVILGVQVFIPLYGFMAVTLGLLMTNLAARDQQRQLAQARAEAREAQLAALRLQLNPHFLFNTLNAISTLILSGRAEDADRMTNRLSDFLRASLRLDPTEMVDLETEIDGLMTYLDIEAVRFGERLRVEVDIADTVRDSRLPALLLQPLAENAVKHGVAPSRDPVTLSIRAWRDGTIVAITVEDDGAGGNAQAAGAGVGLENVRGRLTTTFGSAARLETEQLDPGFRVTVRLPDRVTT